MLEGGNRQLHSFFARHCMVAGGGEGQLNMHEKRYRTKASKFYRDGLQSHIQSINTMGEYCGREASRSTLTRH
jgi:hypothetical protein